MKKAWNPNILLGGAVLLGMIALSGAHAMAAPGDPLLVPVAATIATTLAVEVQPISYGEISISPLGDTIIMIANGSAASDEDITTENGSITSGAKSGAITVTAPGTFKVAALLTDTTTLHGTGEATGYAITLSNIKKYSNVGTVLDSTTGGQGRATFNIGGELRIPAGIPSGEYTGTITIALDFNA